MNSEEKKWDFELENLNKNFETGLHSKLTRSSFKFMKLLGSGAFGKVYLVRSIQSNNQYAMKVLSKSQIKHYELEHQLQREIDILEQCEHEFIIKLFACFEDAR
jgi:serine/threonine protein kinase